ncbi:MAG: arsenate reductase ArsC [Candidatus Solibacter sp.]
MTPVGKKHVLFICIGNACRSQMAEGFARTYGSDVLIPASVGLMPAYAVAPQTIRAMDEKNIDLRDQFPKALRHLGRADFDLLVNMTGFFLPQEFKGKTVDWEIPDPVEMEFAEHCEVRDMIEAQVMKLILELRTPPPTHFRGQGSGRLAP